MLTRWGMSRRWVDCLDWFNWFFESDLLESNWLRADCVPAWMLFLFGLWSLCKRESILSICRDFLIFGIFTSGKMEHWFWFLSISMVVTLLFFKFAYKSSWSCFSEVLDSARISCTTSNVKFSGSLGFTVLLPKVVPSFSTKMARLVMYWFVELPPAS